MPVLRSVKNIVKNYTDAEVKVREATSNDPWGPSSTLMSEIADLTYNVVAFTEIMQMIWKRLNDHGKNWRHVYKSLTLLEYIMKTGSEKVAQQCKENIFAIQTLKDFQHSEDNKDLGVNVREKAKALVALLKDDERLKNERAKALKAKERFTENFGIGSDSTSTQLGKPRHRPIIGGTDISHRTPATLANPELEEARPHSAGEEELQLQLALAMSKEEAENDAKKKTNDDLKLQLALEESKREEAKSEEHLLDFAGGGAAPAATNDPWNPTAIPVQVTTDPWGTDATNAAPVNNQSPFSPLPAASNDPWAASSTAPSALPTAADNGSSNPWEAPSVTATAQSTNDPWAASDIPAAAAPAAATGPSPWDSGFSNGDTSVNTHQPVTIDDDFDALGLRTTPATHPASINQGTNGSDLFDMSSVQGSLPPIQQGQVSLVGPKKAEDFLDPKAKTLVNLDSLITKPATSTGVINPFAMTSLGANGVAPSASNNPFTAQQPPRPSLNEMSANNQMSFNSAGPALANPMVPMSTSTGFQSTHPGASIQPPMYPQQPQQPAAFSTNNPFL